MRTLGHELDVAEASRLAGARPHHEFCLGDNPDLLRKQRAQRLLADVERHVLDEDRHVVVYLALFGRSGLLPRACVLAVAGPGRALLPHACDLVAVEIVRVQRWPCGRLQRQHFRSTALEQSKEGIT